MLQADLARRTGGVPGRPTWNTQELASSAGTVVTTPIVPEPPATNLDPAKAQILFVNLVSRRVVTTIGEFDLDEPEVAQIAYISINCAGRNLQAVLNALHNRYGVNQLAKTPPPAPTATRNDDAIIAQAAAAVEAGSVDIASDPDDFDETNDNPPIPLNRPRPKRGARPIRR
jgi:hypothetical protein